MKRKEPTRWPRKSTAPLELNDAAVLPGFGLSISVRSAKAKFSALLELVASGHQVTITSDGVPKAVLMPIGAKHGRKVFLGMGKDLLGQTIHRGPSAEKLVREDRDARG